MLHQSSSTVLPHRDQTTQVSGQMIQYVYRPFFLSLDLRHFLLEHQDLSLFLLGFRTGDDVYILSAADAGTPAPI